MAALDGEGTAAADSRSAARQHLASCTSCSRWLRELESMNSRFQRLSYPGVQRSLWATVEGRLDARQPAHRLWLIGALVVGWRALELLIDLPLPALHPIVPLAFAVAALRIVARDPLAIETFAPELQKRGV
jgi:hypothetical protein